MKKKSFQFVHFYFFFLAGPIFYRVTYGILKERKEKPIMGRDRDLVSPIRCGKKDDLGKNNNLDENTTTNRDQNTTNNDLDENTTTTNRDSNTTDEFVESMDEDRQALELDRQTEEALTKSSLDREIEKERKREEFIRIRREFLYSKELMKSKEFLSMDDKTREEVEIAAKKKQKRYNEACRKSDNPSWETCENCEESNLVETLHLGYFICQHCGYHMKMDSYSRIEFSIDRHTWIPMNRNITSIDPIQWDLIWNEWYLRVVDSLRQRLKQQYERFKYERLKRNSDDSDDTRTPEDRNLLKLDQMTNSCRKKNVNNSNIDQNQDDFSEIPDPMKTQIEFPTLGELSQTPEKKTAKDQDPEIDQEAYTYIHSMISSYLTYISKLSKEEKYDVISKEKEKFPEEQLSNTKDGSEDSADSYPFTNVSKDGSEDSGDSYPFTSVWKEGCSEDSADTHYYPFAEVSNVYPTDKCDDSDRDTDDFHFDRVSDDYSDSEDMEKFENYSENSSRDSLDVENLSDQGSEGVENSFQGSDDSSYEKGYIENYSDEVKSEFDQGSDDLENNFLYDHGSDLSSGLVSYSDHVSDSSSEVENDDSCNCNDSYSEYDSYSELADSEGSSYASDVRNSSSDRNSGSPKMSDSYESSRRLSSDSSEELSSSDSEKESKESREFSSFSLEELSILSIEDISILLKKELKKMEKILDEMRALILQPFKSLEPFDEFTTYLLFGLEPSEEKEEELSLSEEECTEDTDSEEECTEDTDLEEGCTEDTDSGKECTENTDSGKECTEDTDSEEGCTEDTDSKENQPYMDRLDSDQRKAGLTEAIQTGMGKFKGIPIAIGVMDFEIRGGSMGPAVGEKITRLIEYANHQWIPIILVCSSGGARMQEGILSLMQMAKISSALYEYQLLDKLFYLSILTTPTTGGVTASFGMLGDIILSEPDAHIAFAGKRVIEETLKVIVPEGFQEAEYLFEKGSFDSIVPRNFVKEVLDELLDFHGWNIENGKDSFCWMEKFPICPLDQWERLLLDQSELKELLELE